jgi:RNAse (barnase) inhibitor barstar
MDLAEEYRGELQALWDIMTRLRLRKEVKNELNYLKSKCV